MKQHRFFAVRQFAAALLISTVVFAQGTRITPPKNNYSPADDVKLGREAAAQVRQQMPLLPQNSAVTNYVESVGRRLINAVPREYARPEFNYSFDVVDAREINAFALPGGPMFVNRGMIEQAHTEGEMAGVMAHELSHVLLRHGTAQATKQQSGKIQLGAIGGAILGAVIGGNAGAAIGQAAQVGAAAYLLKYSREYETQADVLGAQLMARAGYDPRDLANMFQTIERESGGRGGNPEWLSSHPNPGNRYERINQEAQLLGVRGRGDSNNAEFSRIQGDLRRMSPAPTSEEIARRSQQQQRYPQEDSRRYPDSAQVNGQVNYPSGSFRNYTGGNLFQLSVPSDWRDFGNQNSVTFAPEGAYGTARGQAVFTHGAIVGVVDAGSRDLQQATDRYVNSLLQGNPYLSPQGGNYQRATIGGRQGLAITLGGVSNATGRDEVAQVYTTILRNGALFYVVNVAPRNQYRGFQRAFQTMLNSVQLND